ncbi:MAG TPA: serpin family protein [Kofleriaceae bacterium]|jgi:serpin B|nr:serpin family protein [Kofleriaceae bacterium]
MRALALLLLLCACEGKKTDPVVVAPEEKPVVTPAAQPADPTALVKGHNNFAIGLYGKLPQGNVAASPASITIALAMTWTGAKGATADEIAKTLHFVGDQAQVLSRWGQLSQSLVDPKRPFTLRLANRLFVDQHRELDTIFFDINFKTFGARMDAFDFQNQPDDARQKINTWVGKQTEDRIKNLLPPRSITSATRLVVVNAIYFLADWAEPFQTSATRPQAFHVTATDAKQVPTMHRLGSYRYAHEGGAALLELPYRDLDYDVVPTHPTNVAMYVLLPDAVDGLPAIEAKLADTVRALQGKLAATQIAVSLPKFTIDPPEPLQLQKTLEELGMKLAFTPSADFTGISKDTAEPLFISGVMHKAFVKVDEKGTEAAAATAVAAPGGGPPPRGTDFVADHPFIFMIIDRSTGLILFIGRVADPS